MGWSLVGGKDREYGFLFYLKWMGFFDPSRAVCLYILCWYVIPLMGQSLPPRERNEFINEIASRLLFINSFFNQMCEQDAYEEVKLLKLISKVNDIDKKKYIYNIQERYKSVL